MGEQFGTAALVSLACPQWVCAFGLELLGRTHHDVYLLESHSHHDWRNQHASLLVENKWETPSYCIGRSTEYQLCFVTMSSV